MKLAGISKTVVVPWDFSEMSLYALGQAITMVGDSSLIRVVHVTEYSSINEYGVVWPTVPEETIVAQLETAFQRETSGNKKFSGVSFTVRFGNPWQAICEFAEELDADMIVMPSHGRTGVTRLLLGSVAERVVRFAHCPVLVLRQKPDQDDGLKPTAVATVLV